MSAKELMARPAWLLVLATGLATIGIFAAVWLWLAIATARKLRLIRFAQRRRLVCHPNPWTSKRAQREYLAKINRLPSLGDAAMDALRQRLRRQSESPIFAWLLLVLFLLFVALVVSFAFASGDPLVLLLIIPLGAVAGLFAKALLTQRDKG